MKALRDAAKSLTDEVERTLSDKLSLLEQPMVDCSKDGVSSLEKRLTELSSQPLVPALVGWREIQPRVSASLASPTWHNLPAAMLLTYKPAPILG